MTNGYHNDHGSVRATDKPKKSKAEPKREAPKNEPVKNQKANSGK